ncbi:aldo/keto reductase [Actinopolyspora erythraea]|uniref:Aldo/keto reductase n=1 Tax=Actinopolyspora erythraea TaxID=414996 RepID=A0A099D5C9_9ACTN|nr:aldo/keto reductase [Actinopolyspora erythraea]ASU78907.1 aldo/keto reductase [Actinopolyspora erythraea]KGI81254.1 aldo/keto reductase [Actinopolyspora erythraea]
MPSDQVIPTRVLGERGPEVSAVGYGAMGLSGVYGQVEDAESERLLRALLDLGINFVDTADVYGDGHNERLLGRVLADRRDEIVLATKFGAGHETGAGRPDYVRTAIDASLRRLGTDHVDLYYLHRVDPETPIEETVGALGELVREGKVGHIGLSEVSSDTLRRAHATHRIAAVQQEYSLFSREPENRLLPTLRELGVGLVAYSPLGRGMLGGSFRESSEVENIDQRRQRYPRFAAQNLDRNLELVRLLHRRAEELGRTPAELALGWLLAQGEDVVPIPGSRSFDKVATNVRAAEQPLDRAVVAELGELFPQGVAAGERYAPEFSARLEL